MCMYEVLPWPLHFHFLILSHLRQSPLTKHNGQHLSGLFLPCVHAPESWIVVMRMRHRPQWRVCSSIGQILHLAAHPDRRLSMLAVPLRLLLLPSLLLQIQLGATAGGVADAAAVVCVHLGQHRVLHRSRLWPFAPQAPWQQAGLGGIWGLYTLLSGQKRGDYWQIVQWERYSAISTNVELYAIIFNVIKCHVIKAAVITMFI